MNSIEETNKSKPCVGMAVTWADPETLKDRDDAQFLQKSMIGKYGAGPFKIHKLEPYTDNGVERAGLSVSLTKRRELLMEIPEFGGVPSSQFYDWHWLQPLPQPKLQIGSLVTWASEDEIDDDVYGRDDVLRDLHEAFGQGPFVVAIQTGLVVTLVDKDTGITLSNSDQTRALAINRCFVSPI
jgi:hypothetical protein